MTRGDLTLERTQRIPRPPDETFAFFADPLNLEAITPPWLRFRILRAPRELRRGSILVYRLRLYGLPVTWVTRIVEWLPGRTFVDVQLAGPYLLWEHAHRFAAVEGGTEVYDNVRYRAPGGRATDRVLVRSRLDAIFDFRARQLAELLGA